VYEQPNRMANHIFVLIPQTQQLNLNTTSTHGIEAGWCAQSIQLFQLIVDSVHSLLINSI
jgi:hypothetical protein